MGVELLSAETVQALVKYPQFRFKLEGSTPILNTYIHAYKTWSLETTVFRSISVRYAVAYLAQLREFLEPNSLNKIVCFRTQSVSCIGNC